MALLMGFLRRHGMMLALFLIALVPRMYVAGRLPPLLDELKLLEEVLRIDWRAIPVHFVGFGWGENVTLGFLSYPFITMLHWHPIATFRVIMLFANMLFLYLVYRFAVVHFNKSIAYVALLFGAIWPWSILAGSIGFNAFLIPAITLGIALSAHALYTTEKSRYWYIALTLSVVSLYTYAASFIWIPTLWFILLFVYRFPRIQKVHYGALIGVVLCALPIFMLHAQSLMGLAPIDRFLFLDFPHLTSTRLQNISYLSGFGLGASLALYLLNYALHFVFTYLSYVPLYAHQSFVEMLGGSGFLFLSNPHFYELSPRTGLYYSSLAYPWDVLFCVVGVFVLWPSRKSLGSKLLLLWLAFYPMGPSFLFADYKAFTVTRDIMGMPALILLSAVGCSFIYEKLKEFLRDRRRSTRITVA